jgi:recombination protein RecT
MSTAIVEFRNTLTSMAPEFGKALPAHVTSDKFTRVVMSAVQANPDVLNADKRTLLGACMKAAQDGLLVDGREAALTVYNSKAGKVVQYMPMIAGILKKARNSGEISTIAAELVYENDSFKYRIINGKPEMSHEPDVFSDRGEIKGAYACAVLKDGSTMIEVMSKADIEKVRAASRAKDSGPWVSWWGEMARKTVLRRLSKRLPSSSDREDDLQRTIQRDDDLYDLDQQQDATPAGAAPAATARPSSLSRVVEAAGATIDGTADEIPPASPENLDDIPL